MDGSGGDGDEADHAQYDDQCDDDDDDDDGSGYRSWFAAISTKKISYGPQQTQTSIMSNQYDANFTWRG